MSNHFVKVVYKYHVKITVKATDITLTKNKINAVIN